jgi:RNA polymerase sigma-70 factor (ECF subfamily)
METELNTDDGLMQAVAAGNRDCLEPLVRRYASPLLTFLQRMLVNRDVAEDMFQEVFVAVWQHRRTFRAAKKPEDGQSFRPWLFAIARNRCRTEFRKVQPVNVSIEDDLIPDVRDLSPLDDAIAAETSVLVEHALTHLTPKQRMVVVMRIWNGLSFAEIARAVGCSESTARPHMHHGLASLRRYLEPRMNRRTEHSMKPREADATDADS